VSRSQPLPILSIAFRVVLLLYLLFAFFYLVRNSDREQWDLSVYRLAGQAFLEGDNPYDLETLTGKAQGRTDLPFVYPPLTLWLFAPLALVDPNALYWAFLILKFVALFFLLFLWRRFFVRDLELDLFFWVCLLAFHGAIAMDIRSGNLSLFEYLGLWTAFAFLAKGRAAIFALLLPWVALFKLTPIFFLILLPIGNHPRKWALFLLSNLLFGSYLALNYFLYPDLFHSFLGNLEGVRLDPDNRGIHNPTLYSLVTETIGVNTFTKILASLLSLAILLITIGVCRTPRWKTESAPRLEILTFSSAFLLILPMSNVYSFVLGIPPLCHVLGGIANKPARWTACAVICLLGAQPLYLPGGSRFQIGIWDFYSVWVVFFVWLRQLCLLAERRKTAAPVDGETGV